MVSRSIIVHATPPRRSPRKKKPGPKPERAIVTAKPPGPRVRPEKPEDPEASAAARAFLRRMGVDVPE